MASTAVAVRFAWQSSTALKKCRLGHQARPLASFASRWATRSCRWRARPQSSLAEKVRLFRLNDGSHEIGYAFAEVIDFAAIEQ